MRWLMGVRGVPPFFFLSAVSGDKKKNRRSCLRQFRACARVERMTRGYPRAPYR